MNPNPLPLGSVICFNEEGLRQFSRPHDHLLHFQIVVAHKEPTHHGTDLTMIRLYHPMELDGLITLSNDELFSIFKNGAADKVPPFNVFSYYWNHSKTTLSVGQSHHYRLIEDSIEHIASFSSHMPIVNDFLQHTLPHLLSIQRISRAAYNSPLVQPISPSSFL